jgi:hypothetical protein
VLSRANASKAYHEEAFLAVNMDSDSTQNEISFLDTAPRIDTKRRKFDIGMSDPFPKSKQMLIPDSDRTISFFDDNAIHSPARNAKLSISLPGRG